MDVCVCVCVCVCVYNSSHLLLYIGTYISLYKYYVMYQVQNAAQVFMFA